MIYCVSRSYSKTSEPQHQIISSLSTLQSKPPETNSNSIHDLYVSNNMMKSMYIQTRQYENRSKTLTRERIDDSQFNQYRQRLKKQISEKKVIREQEIQTKANYSKESLQDDQQLDQKRGSRTVPNLNRVIQQQQVNKRTGHPILLKTTQNEIHLGQYKFTKSEIKQDPQSISNVPEDEVEVHLPMKFKPFLFKE